MLGTRFALRTALLTPLTALPTPIRIVARPSKFRRLATMSEPAPAAAVPAAEASEGADGGPSKGELKKRAKEAEKERKRLEREQREAEQKAAREAADVVRHCFVPVVSAPVCSTQHGASRIQRGT